MVRQLVFALALLTTASIFAWTLQQLIRNFRFTKANFPVRDLGQRTKIMLKVAFGQTKIFRWPVLGLLHALVFWGFCVILIGSIEMIVDGLFGTERILSHLGAFYDLITASGDLFALIVSMAILVFLFRRLFLHVNRFEGLEMKAKSHRDAHFALTMILLLMVSLLGMNFAYLALKNAQAEPVVGWYPVSQMLIGWLPSLSQHEAFVWHEVFWWAHILLIFLFANILPYSKHFHVFLSVPNTFLTRLEPLGKLSTMMDVAQEVRFMLDPEYASAAQPTGTVVQRFGVKDVEDVSWKNYFDSLTCTECGRCTSVCPANTTGKKLSPRKIFMDLRARMKEKGPLMARNGKDFDDNKSLLRSFISEEELWACTTCNACAQECPVNINHPTLILDMRRYLVMEESNAPTGIKTMFSNIENNGAPWQFSAEDRLQWTLK